MQDQLRHILITGASSGIGAELARLYATSGVLLSLGGRDVQRLADVAGQCRGLGASVDHTIVDVADADAVSAWVLACDDAVPVDLLICSAGAGGVGSLATAAGEDPESASSVATVNLLGVIHTVAPLVPRFVHRRGGHIALISSMAAFIGLPHAPAYSASKAAVRVYGDALRRLVMDRSVRVSVVHPGYVHTPMSASLPFPLHLAWPVEKAARHIARRLAAGDRTIAFPRIVHLAMVLARLVPAPVLDRILSLKVRRDLDKGLPPP